MQGRLSWLMFVALAAAAGWARSAHACSIGGLPTFEPTDDPDDTEPPPAIVSADATWKGLDEPGCGTSSCDDVYMVRFDLVSGEGEPTAAYLIEHADGDLPPGLSIPSEPSPATDGAIWLHYVDDPDRPESFSFTVRISPVDAAGNIGPASEPVSVQHGGSGCRTVPSRGRGLALALGLVVLAAARGRRRRNGHTRTRLQ
jgi:hypothetical protein